jgi:hypothetical protein
LPIVVCDRLWGGAESKSGMVCTKAINPVLYRVLHGSSSTTLRPLGTDSGKGGPFRVFHNSALNDAYVFKFPHFDDRDVRRWEAALSVGNLPQDSRRIDTGIFFPDDRIRPETGGVAVYVGQRNFRQVLAELIGLDTRADTDDARHDLEILDTLNDLPSLDPFLMKAAFELRGLSLADGTIVVTDAESKAIREALIQRLGPVISKAFIHQVLSPAAKAAKIAKEVWNPRSEQMRQFCMAFRIPVDEAPQVIFALQGMSFYEHLLASTRDVTTPLARYLREEATKPNDASKYHSAELAQIDTIRQECLGMLKSHLTNASQVFQLYDEGVSAFVGHDRPGPLIDFLRLSSSFYWSLGHCVTSRINAALVLQDSLRSMRPALAFANIETTLQRIRASLAPRVDPI